MGSGGYVEWSRRRTGPGLLRRRYSVPEIIMRKYTLAHEKSESEDNEEVNNTITPSHHQSRDRRETPGVQLQSSGTETILSNEMPMRQTLLRRMYQKEMKKEEAARSGSWSPPMRPSQRRSNQEQHVEHTCEACRRLSEDTSAVDTTSTMVTRNGSSTSPKRPRLTASMSTNESSTRYTSGTSSNITDSTARKVSSYETSSNVTDSTARKATTYDTSSQTTDRSTSKAPISETSSNIADSTAKTISMNVTSSNVTDRSISNALSYETSSNLTDRSITKADNYETSSNITDRSTSKTSTHETSSKITDSSTTKSSKCNTTNSENATRDTTTTTSEGNPTTSTTTSTPEKTRRKSVFIYIQSGDTPTAEIVSQDEVIHRDLTENHETESDGSNFLQTPLSTSELYSTFPSGGAETSYMEYESRSNVTSSVRPSTNDSIVDSSNETNDRLDLYITNLLMDNVNLVIDDSTEISSVYLSAERLHEIVNKQTDESSDKTSTEGVKSTHVSETKISVNGDSKTPDSDVETAEEATESLSVVATGSIYQKALSEHLIVPRYSAIPRTESMEVNESSADMSNVEEESDCESLVDSLDDPASPRSSNKYDSKLVQSSVIALLPDNSEETKKERGEAFFISMNNGAVEDNIVVAEHLPVKVRERLVRRQRKRDMRKENALRKKMKKAQKCVEQHKRRKESEASTSGLHHEHETSADTVILKSEESVVKMKKPLQQNSLKVATKSRRKRDARDEILKLESFKIDSQGNMKMDTPPKEDTNKIIKKRAEKIKSLQTELQGPCVVETNKIVKVTNDIHKNYPKIIDVRKKQLKSDVHHMNVYNADSEYLDFESIPRRLYQKTEIQDGDKRIEILEIVECVDSSPENSPFRHVFRSMSQSRIPIPIYKPGKSSGFQKSFRISSSSSRETSPLNISLARSSKMTFSPGNSKVDRLIAELLIDAMNNPDSDDVDFLQSPLEILQKDRRNPELKRLPQPGPFPARRASLPQPSMRKSANAKYHRKFEVIPEERSSLSIESSNEDSSSGANVRRASMPAVQIVAIEEIKEDISTGTHKEDSISLEEEPIIILKNGIINNIVRDNELNGNIIELAEEATELNFNEISTSTSENNNTIILESKTEQNSEVIKSYNDASRTILKSKTVQTSPSNISDNNSRIVLESISSKNNEPITNLESKRTQTSPPAKSDNDNLRIIDESTAAQTSTPPVKSDNNNSRAILESKHVQTIVAPAKSDNDSITILESKNVQTDNDSSTILESRPVKKISAPAKSDNNQIMLESRTMQPPSISDNKTRRILETYTVQTRPAAISDNNNTEIISESKNIQTRAPFNNNENNKINKGNLHTANNADTKKSSAINTEFFVDEISVANRNAHDVRSFIVLQEDKSVSCNLLNNGGRKSSVRENKSVLCDFQMVDDVFVLHGNESEENTSQDEAINRMKNRGRAALDGSEDISSKNGGWFGFCRPVRGSIAEGAKEGGTTYV